jgi:hypothetical protein
MKPPLLRISRISVVCLLGIVGRLGLWAQVTGNFDGVSFWATTSPDGKRQFSAEGGTGTLKNDKGEIVAQGQLTTKNQSLGINGRSGASFGYEPKTATFADNIWPNKEETEFALVEMSAGNRWTLKDDNFYFALEIPALNRPQIVIDLDKSLARASIISVPNGIVRLWGYTVKVEKSRGVVRVMHGKIVEATDASYETAQ